MSIKVRELLERLGIETTREERLEIDREVERRTGQDCDTGVEMISLDEFLKIVEEVKARRKRKVAAPTVV